MEDIVLSGVSREEKYKELTSQVKALTDYETDIIANLSNVMAALKFGLDFFWVGIYLKKENELVLGPFQGPIACTRISYGKGVCGTVWKSKTPLIVDNVDEFPGHIACSSASKSEIVLPIFAQNNFFGVLDIDSDKIADFNSVDLTYLRQIVKIIEDLI